MGFRRRVHHSPAVFVRQEVALLRSRAHDMEFNPRTQWVFHRRMSWFWIFSFVPLTVFLAFDICATLGYFSTGTVLMLTAIMLGYNTYCSVYANFATDFDAVSAAYAAMQAEAAAGQLHSEDQQCEP